MLAEWVSTDAARVAVRDLLAPLDALGPAKSTTAIATLHAYLDERGCPCNARPPGCMCTATRSST